MKANRKTRLARQTRKDVLRFAPNFTAYVLPPDAVCLYSEDRKFFLHGELYCALATAIGRHGKTAPEIVRQLSRNFPAEKIEEAIKRLLERQYIVTRASHPFADTVAGYWASLGLSAEVAERNLRECPVQIETIDVGGAKKLSKQLPKQLAAALSRFGVQIVKRSPKLTITLVSDYLDGRLAEINREHVANKTPWLLAQPSGVFPLVGPVFKPGETACWTCLFDRMIRNREVKGFLDRGSARAIAVSSLVNDSVGQTAIHFAALEIAKAIASSFRTDLRDHIASFDLTGAVIAKHYVTRRPQCPICGSKRLHSPRRAAKPIEIAEGRKLVMTSGGYRTVTSGATVARFRKHVSPLTGVVTRLARIDVDLPMNTNFFAQHNFSAPAWSVDQLRSGLSGGSFGKGSTAEQGEASALMEAIERYSGIFQGDEIRIERRFVDFASGDALLPNDVQLFSETQFRNRQSLPPDDPHPVPEPLDPSAPIEWSPVWSLRDKRFKYLPTGLLYFFYEGAHTDSNGCAAGNTRDEAIVQGFLELVERDAYAIWWYNQVQRAEVNLKQFDDSYVQDMQAQFIDAGRRLWVLDVTSDLGIPTYVAIMHWRENGHENIEFGSGAHFDRRIALLRSLTELSQFLAVEMMGGTSGEKPTLDGVTPFRLEDYPFLVPSDDPTIRPAPALRVHDNTRDQVNACVEIATRAGYDFLVLDQTRPDVEVPVVRVLVPGLRHFYLRFAPGRLYDVPVKLGLLGRPRLESELTPFLPHT